MAVLGCQVAHIKCIVLSCNKCKGCDCNKSTPLTVLIVDQGNDLLGKSIIGLDRIIQHRINETLDIRYEALKVSPKPYFLDETRHLFPQHMQPNRKGKRKRDKFNMRPAPIAGAPRKLTPSQRAKLKKKRRAQRQARKK